MKKNLLQKIGSAFVAMCLFSSVAVFITACEKDEEYVEVKPEEEESPGQNDDSNNNNQTATIAEAIDLGLSVKWASHNIGATKPEDYGGYYAWGETEEKEEYSLDTYLYCQEDKAFYIGDNISGTKYDVAHVKWGDNWRMPSSEEVNELHNNCSWKWTSSNGVNGFIVTGPNGNSIFLPAAGYHNRKDFYYAESQGIYWSGGFDNDNEFNANYFILGNSDHHSGFCSRIYGLSIRPVLANPEQEEDSNSNTQTVTPGEAIDLGLSVKWASHNVGASKPEEYGDYYAWGETEEKTNYSATTYQHRQDGNYVHIGDNICGTSYDVARVKWGGSWRMPSKEEMKELDEKCSWEWTSYNGTNGYIVTGPNGNSIFLPAAGGRYGTDLYDAGSDGYYWSGSLNEGYEFGACFLCFGSGYHYWSLWYDRFYGLSVRPVSD